MDGHAARGFYRFAVGAREIETFRLQLVPHGDSDQWPQRSFNAPLSHARPNNSNGDNHLAPEVELHLPGYHNAKPFDVRFHIFPAFPRGR
jgi:hypothetical protein